MMQSIINKKDSNPFIITAVVVYAMIYEWGIFEAAPKSLIFTIKVFLPCLLLFLTPLRKVNFTYLNKFVIFFILFMLWGFIPSVFSSYYVQTIIQWLKFLPRVLFFVIIGTYLLHKPIGSITLAKSFIIIGFLSVIQFLFLFITMRAGITINSAQMGAGVYYGPFGLLGNQIAMMNFPGIQFPVLRLTGFWVEPSKASGFLLATFFLARGIYTLEKRNFWKLVSYSCLIGGFLCLSIAGYLAIIIAFLFGIIVRSRILRVFIHFKITKGALFRFFCAVVLIVLVVLVFAGRSLVAEKYYHNTFLRSIMGVQGAAEVVLESPLDYRVGLLKKNIPIWFDNLFGIGFRIPGKTSSKESFWLASATAPILWLTYTGFIGLFLLLLRDAQVVIVFLKSARQSDYVRNVFQAWVVMFTQHLSYGDWMSPVYLVLCALVFCAAYNASFFSHIAFTSTVISNFSFKNTPKEKRQAGIGGILSS
jgi:hypothetical protein